MDDLRISMANYPKIDPMAVAYFDRRDEMATSILAAMIARDGDIQDPTHAKRVGYAKKAVEWADALIDALKK